MTKKTRRKIDVAPRSVAIASTISGSLYGTCSICLYRGKDRQFGNLDDGSPDRDGSLAGECGLHGDVPNRQRFNSVRRRWAAIQRAGASQLGGSLVRVCFLAELGAFSARSMNYKAPPSCSQSFTNLRQG